MHPPGLDDRIVLAMHRARELSPAESPELHQIVEELAVRAAIPRPRVYLLPQMQPNAFSTHPSMRERIRRLRAMQGNAGGWPVRTRDATLDASW